MKRMTCLIAVLVALSAISATAQTSGRIQPLTAAGCTGDIYFVQDGDRLYTKYGPAWELLLGVNPGLGARITRISDDIVTAMLYPTRHDKLCLPAGMNSDQVIRNATTPPPDSTIDKPFTGTEVVVDKGDTKVATASTPWYLSPWFLTLLVLTVFGILAYLYMRNRNYERERELASDPVTSGPPIVAGGIPATDTNRLANHFQDRAVAQYVRATPGTDAVTVRPNIVRVGAIEEGMISGEGLVGYADRARPRRINPPQSGYRAAFRFPDGSEQQLMSLQACMNPCMWGEGMSGFVFTARSVAVPTPEPEQPAPQAVPHPAIAVTRIRAGAEAEGASTILVGGKMVTVAHGVHFDLDRTPGSVVITGGEFEMTVKPRRSISTNRPKAIATGTDKQ